MYNYIQYSYDKLTMRLGIQLTYGSSQRSWEEDKGIELGEIRSIHLGFVWCGLFVVDGRKELV